MLILKQQQELEIFIAENCEIIALFCDRLKLLSIAENIDERRLSSAKEGPDFSNNYNKLNSDRMPTTTLTSNKFYAIILFIIHTICQIYLISFRFFQKLCRKSLQSLNINQPDYFHIKLITRNLKKVPRYVAYAVVGDNHSLELDSYDVKAVAKLVSWTWASGVSIISLYDITGQIRDNSTELEIYLEKAIAKLGNGTRLPKVDIKFHNVNKGNKDLQGVEKLDTTDKLHIIVFSAVDGRQGIVDAVKMFICESENASGNNNKKFQDTHDNFCSKDVITEAKINEALDVCLEPDLLVVFGSSYSTLGFLPWHIRLTEIHWLPTFPVFNIQDFTTILEEYAACDQKIGK